MLSLIPILLQAVGPILARVIPDPKAQAEAQAELIKAVSENQSAIMGAMADVMKADAASDSWMTRNARPTVVYWSLTMITGFMIASLFGAGPDLTAAFKGIPQQLWDMTTYGIGAYILGKSGVDIAKAVRK